MKTLVTIPAFNEEGSIVAVVNEIKAEGYDYIVINDGSTDNTLSICESNNIRALNLTKNLGIGGAVQTGHRYAFENGYDISIQFDGDGQHCADFIPLLVEEIERGADLAIGSRFLEESDGFRSTFMRRVGIKWLSMLIRVLCGTTITDPTSGFRASGRKAIELFCMSYPIDYPEPESIVEAIGRRLRVSEIPVQMQARTEGKSSIKPLTSVYYMVKVSLAVALSAINNRSLRQKGL
jgi:glycosyltransferase involved in cell wall biosynthesis